MMEGWGKEHKRLREIELLEESSVASVEGKAPLHQVRICDIALHAPLYPLYLGYCKSASLGMSQPIPI